MNLNCSTMRFLTGNVIELLTNYFSSKVTSTIETLTGIVSSRWCTNCLSCIRHVWSKFTHCWNLDIPQVTNTAYSKRVNLSNLANNNDTKLT